MLYRALANLDAGKTQIKEGDVFPGNVLGDKARAKLEQVGAIKPCSSPPLAALPGWKTRAEKFEPAGVITVENLIDMPDGSIAELFEVSLDRVTLWKRDALDWLKAPRSTGG